MTTLIRRCAHKRLLLFLESTPGFPAQTMAETRLGADAVRCRPAAMLGTLPLKSDCVVVCLARGPSARAVTRQLGARLPALPPSGYRIQTVHHRAGRALVVAGGDVFGLLAGLADVLQRSCLNRAGLSYRGGDRTEKPAFPLRYYWTWDHSTNWVLDDPGNQVEGCNNRYGKKPETFREDYRRLVDHCVEMRFNGIIIWGFLRDAHGGERLAHEIARYAADRGVAIMPGVGTTGYGGIYYQGRHPANLETYLAAHPERGNLWEDGQHSAREATPYHQANQDWIAASLDWLYRTFPIGGVNLENNDLMVDYSPAGKRGRARIKSGEADHFKDQYFAYKTALEVADRLAPDKWNTYATYSGFGRGRDLSNAGADMGIEPYFAKRMPPSAIAQWTITGMVSEHPIPLRDWLGHPRPARAYQNPRWPKGLRPPTPRSAGFLHQASQWHGIRRNRPAISTFAEACLRSAEAGLEGISVHGEVTSRTLAWRLNYLAMRHWTYHPRSTLEEFAAAELAPRVGGDQCARDFIEALALLDEGKADDAYQLARKHRGEWYPLPYPEPAQGDIEIARTWTELCEWATARVAGGPVRGFTDVL
ncbi:hypothetical protein HQ590_11355 [bacterium]|nr:hypothetical protein [bacterium]